MGEGNRQQWTNAGGTEPKKGRYRTAGEWLIGKLCQGATQFTAAEWAIYGFADIERDDYILAGTNYFVPSGNGSALYILNYWALTRGYNDVTT
jgi:hypothetical protein